MPASIEKVDMLLMADERSDGYLDCKEHKDRQASGDG